MSTGERELAEGLARALAPGMLVMADRGFFSFPLWAEFMSTGADLLFRVPSGMKLPVIEALPDGSYLSEVTSKKVRSSGYRIPLATVDDPREATHIPVRVVEYTVSGSGDNKEPEIYRVITTVLEAYSRHLVEVQPDNS